MYVVLWHELFARLSFWWDLRLNFFLPLLKLILNELNIYKGDQNFFLSCMPKLNVHELIKLSNTCFFLVFFFENMLLLCI